MLNHFWKHNNQSTWIYRNRVRKPYEKRDPLVQKHLDAAANGPKAQKKKLLKELDRAKSKEKKLKRPISNRTKDFGFDLWKSGDGSGIAQ